MEGVWARPGREEGKRGRKGLSVGECGCGCTGITRGPGARALGGGAGPGEPPSLGLTLLICQMAVRPREVSAPAVLRGCAFWGSFARGAVVLPAAPELDGARTDRLIILLSPTPDAREHLDPPLTSHHTEPILPSAGPPSLIRPRPPASGLPPAVCASLPPVSPHRAPCCCLPLPRSELPQPGSSGGVQGHQALLALPPISGAASERQPAHRPCTPWAAPALGPAWSVVTPSPSSFSSSTLSSGVISSRKPSTPAPPPPSTPPPRPCRLCSGSRFRPPWVH